MSFREWLVSWFGNVGFIQLRLEADAVILDARIGDGEDPNLLVAGRHVRYVEAEHFQALFELFDSEIILVQHGVILSDDRV